MTREEAIKWLEETIQDTDIYWESCSEALQKELDEQKEVFLLALTALRPVSREQVEKAWRGEWKIITTHHGCIFDQDCVCSRCGASGIPNKPFCDSCGAPMMDYSQELGQVKRRKKLFSA